MVTIEEIKNKIYAQKFLIETQRATIGVLKAKIEWLEKVKEIASNVLNNIHEDIFYKEPRGQNSTGQVIRMHRCKDLLNVADELRKVLQGQGN